MKKIILLLFIFFVGCKADISTKKTPSVVVALFNNTNEDVVFENLTDNQTVTLPPLSPFSLFTASTKGIKTRVSAKSGKAVKVTETFQYGVYTYIIDYQ